MSHRFIVLKKAHGTIAALICALILIGALSSLRATPRRTRDSWLVEWQPSHLINGSPMVIEVAAPAHLKTLAAKWLGHDVYFAFDRHSKKWYGLAGVGQQIKEGTYPLELNGITSEGTTTTFVTQIAVARGNYTNIAITVEKKFTEPNPQQIGKAAEDKKLKQDIFSRVDPLRQWSGSFQPPVQARTSDVFGTQRTFNGQVQSTHQGLDFAVPTGTPVAALNSGTVLVARPMFFEGNCVMIDHGQGLLTIYMHMSEFKVKEGEHVRRGQLIGLSGGTGRASGPHLHVAVRWEGVYLDPATIFLLKLP
jgi:murein DD-endopeptidase MepM/ murein hydrolase activator NlpD